MFSEWVLEAYKNFSPSYTVSEHSQKYKETSNLVIYMT